MFGCRGLGFGLLEFQGSWVLGSGIKHLGCSGFERDHLHVGPLGVHGWSRL